MQYPCDLHMEHLNRQLKTMLRVLGANITPAVIVKAGQALATELKVCQVSVKVKDWPTIVVKVC